MGTKWAHAAGPRHDVPVPEAEMIAKQPEQAWLLIAVGANRQYAGNDGYDDAPDVHYSWDSTVNNAQALHVGDPIALWDKTTLLGASVIEEIETGKAEKVLKSCPTCRKSSIKERKTKSPLYRCHECTSEFDDPHTEVRIVTTYRSRHDAGWTDLNGVLDAAELRQLCANPGDQLSLRRLRWDDFAKRVTHIVGPDVLASTTGRIQAGAPGHVEITVRARLGQSAFRKKLLGQHGSVCAFTGNAPAQVLEAAHLYSYADLGVHHEHGGLLMRRDLHRLFDEGMLGIDPDTRTIVVATDLEEFPQYRSLSGEPIHAALNSAHFKWLHTHWAQYRLEARRIPDHVN